MAILRAMGARPQHVFILLISEAMLVTFMGIVTGVVLLYLLLGVAQPIIHQIYGISITLSMMSPYEFLLLGLVQAAGTLIGIIPAIRAYRQSLADGMTIRI